MRRFARFAAVDWSGEAVAHPRGLAVAVAGAAGPPQLLDRRWSRPALLDWLLTLAETGDDMLVGLDLSPSLPFVDRGSFFPGWHAAPDTARALWALVDHESAHDPHLSANGFLAHEVAAEHFLHRGRRGRLYEGTAGRLRACERAQATMGLSPYSCLRLIGAAQVGKSSLTGMRVLHRLGGRVPVWPFDPVPVRGPLIVEIYTAIAAVEAGRAKGRSKIRDHADLDAALAALGSPPTDGAGPIDDHRSDALLAAAWLRIAATREALWHPQGLTRRVATTEGWTFGAA